MELAQPRISVAVGDANRHQSVSVVGLAESLHPDVPPGTATAVIADSHPLTLEGLTHLLQKCSIDVLERCRTGDHLLASLVSRQPSLALIDVRISPPDGLTVLRQVRERGLHVPVILLSGGLEDRELLEGVRLGIRGLVQKDAELETVAQCVRAVLAGGTCVDQALVGRALSSMLTREAALRDLARLLTAREVQIFQMVVSGRRAREIATVLCVSDGTVKVHLHHIYEKLKVCSRSDLIEYGRSRGIS